jgi:hypothetical protein
MAIHGKASSKKELVCYLNIYISIIFNPTVLILLLQYSFTLAQNNSENPFLLATQKYQASGISTEMFKQLDELLVQYSTMNQEEERVKVIMDFILHFHICE